LILPLFLFRNQSDIAHTAKMVSGGKLKRHIVRKHKSDPEVAEILKQNKTV